MTSAAEWANAHGLPILSRPCEKCGAEFQANEPFMEEGWVGLQAAPHECGERYRLRVMLPANLQERAKQKARTRSSA